MGRAIGKNGILRAAQTSIVQGQTPFLPEDRAWSPDSHRGHKPWSERDW